MFGTPSTPTFGTPSTPAFGTPSSTPAFGNPFSTPATTAFGSSSLFGTPSPFFQQQQQQQQQQNPTPAPTQSPFGFQQLGNVQTTPAPQQSQLTTQMAPVAPLLPPLVDRDIMAIVDAYKDEPGNPKYSFRHLLFSVTDPTARVKPLGASDIMWAEAVGKLEGMESSDRERLWPQLVQGFKDLSQRLKLQDEVIVSDADRLRNTQTNVKLLQRHCQADILPWIQRMKQKEQSLQRRLLRIMRIIEALEGRGLRVPLTKGEAEMSEKLSSITKQLNGPGAGLSSRVYNLMSIARMRASAGAVGSSVHLPGSAKIDELSLSVLQEVLQQQTKAISRLGNVLKRDARDTEIMISEDTEMADGDTGA